MWIRQLRIENFRGLSRVQLNFSERQTVLVGTNGSGKSTVMEALALLFGKDRQVRALTEHDFNGSDPQAPDRIRLVATITGFQSNTPDEHGQWFSAGRGVPKWLDQSTGQLRAEAASANDLLCLQVGFCARFDRDELECETVRYFHDDDSIIDPFDDDLVQTIPRGLISEVGFFVIPAQRTWDRLVSFGSEFFRRMLGSSGTLEAVEVLGERDRLRGDDHRVDQSGALGELRERISSQLKQLIPGQPELELRLTGTDSDSLLNALIPHYKYENAVSLPAARHGSGLLSLQTTLLVLEIAERRRAAGLNVIIAVEEPELHMQPGIQGNILHRLRGASNQLICTTHSPRVAAMYPATDVRAMCLSEEGRAGIISLLETSLPATAKNGIRKLFHESRQAYVEALMHRFLLIPEGRTDVEWLKLLTWQASGRVEIEAEGPPRQFGMLFGLAPTHDACVVETVEYAMRVRKGVTALVDGDDAGDRYVTALLAMAFPPQNIVQWPANWTIEDVVGWLLDSDPAVIAELHRTTARVPATLPELVAWLKLPTSAGGAKTDYLAYEAITDAITTSSLMSARTQMLLEAFVEMAERRPQSILVADAIRSNASCQVWRMSP